MDTEVGDGSRINEVWHIRHGKPGLKTLLLFDPSLTRSGHVQASGAGLYLKTLPFTKRQQVGSFEIVYTSPLVRAVQTAVCVSKALGNLPVQVVPGLCSCTAALKRLGYENVEAALMTDEDMIKTFPGVNLVPRDPLAPTSFEAASAWLASKASQKTASERDDDRCSRVLAVGHQEGLKAMSSDRELPMPHCCIGIFRVKTRDEACAYELQELLSQTGESLMNAAKSPSYARPTGPAIGEENGLRNDADDDDAAQELAARVIDQTVNLEGPKPEKWFDVVRSRPKPDTSVRIFCAPWAGASASSFNAWPSLMPEVAELHALQLPGRMRRSKEDCLTSIKDIVEGAAQALIEQGLLDRPFALFGQGLGALVMFELARKLAKDAGKAPLCLVLSGCRSPDMFVQGEMQTPTSELPRDALLDHLIEIGTMPADLRGRDVLVNYLLPPIRADYTAFESYRYETDDHPTLACPLFCIGGEKDNEVSPSDMESGYTTGNFRLRTFEGGHFFFHGKREQEVFEFLSDVLTTPYCDV